LIRPTGRPEVLGIAISNPDRVLDPETGFTKLDLARYYEVVAERMLPEVVDRPLMTKRCPGGWSAPCFFQKHPSGTIPAVLGRVEVRESKGVDTYLVVRDAAGLAALAQIGALEIHVWGSRADRIEQPDRVVFDLDPDPAVTWDRVVNLARALRERLAALELETFLKTTGGKGLHVIAPLARRAAWPEVLAFAHVVAAGLVREDPRGLTLEMSKAKRAGKILIDTLRNGRGATWVAPYSTRARAGAPVSMPIDWKDLGTDLRPDGVRAPDLLRDGLPKRDPWRDLPRTRQSLTAAIRRAAVVKG
jgi:bifunctional non-homologous end joining protein LigD